MEAAMMTLLQWLCHFHRMGKWAERQDQEVVSKKLLALRGVLFFLPGLVFALGTKPPKS